MSDAGYSFGPFRLDPGDRRLTRGGETVELNPRYLDALLLMLQTPGRLVSKARFHEQVWRGIPVTDEALTQCIRTLRRTLGDDAGAPRFIETVPRHGYRFIAPVARESPDPAPPPALPAAAPVLADGVAAALGGAVAGTIGGLAYLAAGLVSPGIGAASTLLVLVSINLLLGTAGGAAVGLGVAWAAVRRGRDSGLVVAGGALGGLVIGALGQMIGSDLFDLLFGRPPGRIAGGFEGAALGAATGLGVLFCAFQAGASPLRRALPGFLVGGAAGVAIALLDGRLVVGSLAELIARFPDSRLRIGPFAALFGETGLGPVTLVAATAFEAALFAGCIVAALDHAGRRRESRSLLAAPRV